MDFDVLIPLFGIVFVIGPFSALFFSWTPIGKAVINRLNRSGRISDDEIAELREELELLRESLARDGDRYEELHERLDFAERMLASGAPKSDAEPERVITPV